MQAPPFAQFIAEKCAVIADDAMKDPHRAPGTAIRGEFGID